MANNTWSNYTEKTATPVDTDEVMARDSTDGKNKRLLFGTFWKWVAKKLNEATISELQTSNKTIVGALNQLNSDVKNSDIKYIKCGGYGTLAAFSIGKLLYCKFNGTDKTSEVEQQDIAQLPSEYTLDSSIGVYRSVLVNTRNTGSLEISVDGKIALYCPRTYLYGQIIIPIK